MKWIRYIGEGAIGVIGFLLLTFLMLVACFFLSLRIEDGTGIGGESGYAVLVSSVYFIVWMYQSRQRKKSSDTASIVTITIYALLLMIPLAFTVWLFSPSWVIAPITSFSMIIPFGLLLFLVATPLVHFFLCLAKCVQVILLKKKHALQPYKTSGK